MQSNTTASHAQNEALKPKKLYLAGVGVTHSVGAPMHNTISQGLNLPWTFSNLECPTIQDVVTTFRRSDFAGGVITMPYKKGIIPHLDYLDDLVIQLGACNNVYLDKEGKLRGTNTDWRGVKGCLLAGSSEGRGRPALLVGAGGAARAAVYALFEHLDCITIYLINRDAKEVEDLKTDVQAYLGSGDKKINLVCVTSPAQVASLEPAYYIVGTVPDFEPSTLEELAVRACLEAFLHKGETKGVFLDMCFKPRWTRQRKLADGLGWITVDGVEVIGYQMTEQWRLWAGDDIVDKIPVAAALRVMRDAADKSKVLN